MYNGGSNAKEQKAALSKSMVVEYLLDDKDQDLFVFSKPAGTVEGQDEEIKVEITGGEHNNNRVSYKYHRGRQEYKQYFNSMAFDHEKDNSSEGNHRRRSSMMDDVEMQNPLESILRP